MSNTSVYIELPPNGSDSWREAVATVFDLPVNATLGDARVAKDTSIIYVWDGSAWQAAGGGGGGITSINTDTTADQVISAASSGTDFTIATSSGTTTIAIPSASATARGLITTGSQTLAGAKTFSSAPVISALTASQAVVTDSGKALSSLAYTNANTVSTLVQRDSSGNFSAGTITASLTGSISGNAATVTTNANLTGPITSSGNATSIASQTGTGTKFVVDTSPVLVTPNLGTPSAVVLTNATGTASSLTAGTATNATNVATTATNSTNASFFPTFVASSSSGNQGVDTATGLTFNPSTNTLVTTTFSGAVTGHASLDLPLTGGTMTGPINMPAGSASTAEITGGTSNTGFFFPTSATAAYTSGGAEIWRTGANGITIGNTTAQTARLYLTQSNTADTGLVFESGTTAGRKMAFDFSGANAFFFGKTGSNYTTNVMHTATGGTGVGWISIGANGPANPVPYPQHFNCISADGNVTALSSVKSLDGVNVNGAPWVVLSNANSTVNTIVGWVTTGSSKNPMSFAGSVNKTQTASSEVSDYIIATQKAGTLTEAVRVTNLGQVVLQESGAGLSIKTGSNCKMGTSTLVGGTVTVSTTAVTASSIIFLTNQNGAGVTGSLSIGTVTAGTSFVINSTSAADTASVGWLIVEPS